MTNLSNYARTGASGITITTSDTGSGDKWDIVNTGGGTSTTQWDNSQSIHDGLSMMFATPAGATTAYTAWTTQAGSLARCFGRAYVRLPASPPTASSVVARFLAASSQKARIYVNTSGKVVVGDNTNANQANTTATVPANAWWRVEWDITSGVSAAFEVRYYASAESYTPTETLTGSASNFGAANFDEVRFGTGASLASVVGYWLDDVNYNDIGFPGPSQLWTPPPLIVARPTYFLLPPRPTILRASVQEFATPVAVQPIVAGQATPVAKLPPAAILRRASLQDFPTPVTPGPIVVSPGRLTVLIPAPAIMLRASVQDFATPPTPCPLVVTAVARPALTPTSLILRPASTEGAVPAAAGSQALATSTAGMATATSGAHLTSTTSAGRAVSSP